MAQVEIESDVTGSVWKVECSVGDEVAEGDVLIILESMKMEIPVEATAAGTVVELRVEPEQQVEEGDIVAVLES